MVTVTSDISENKFDDIISVVRSRVLATPSLTPRSKQELRTALKAGNLAVAYDADTIIGWIIATPYTSTVQELGMAYIMPEYRNTGLFSRLMNELIDKRPVTIAVTYEVELKEALQKIWGFKPSTLKEFTRISKGRFLMSRVRSIQTISAVFAHTARKKPNYLIRRVS